MILAMNPGVNTLEIEMIITRIRHVSGESVVSHVTNQTIIGAIGDATKIERLTAKSSESCSRVGPEVITDVSILAISNLTTTTPMKRSTVSHRR